MTQDAFRNPYKMAAVNDTLIALITKLQGVFSIKQFRPITLCNVSIRI